MKPSWLKVKLPSGKYYEIKHLLDDADLNTVCQEAKCPNISECFGKGTATFMILGNVCTRDCRYCNVQNGTPEAVDLFESIRIAKIVKELALKYVVITSVTRDDLVDSGAQHFANTIKEIKDTTDCKVEVLIPDMNGSYEFLKKIIQAKPEVLNHNIETTKNLFKDMRPEGSYPKSLELLMNCKKINKNQTTKSGFMVGLGENKQDILNTMEDLTAAKTDILTIGQYLQPSRSNAEVKKYYSPEEFQEFKRIALEMGFKHVESGPLVRSSYCAEKSMQV